MARTYRALAALLSYPTDALQGATGEIAAVLAEEGLVPLPRRAAIDDLLAELAGRDIYDLQERYFALFDRSRTLSLHLFEHVHGESRDRGQAMADLIALYRGHGLEPTAGELPDFLPLFLEFISLLPAAGAQSLLAESAAILGTLAERLVTRKSAYAAVFAALAALANAPAVDVPDTGVEDPDDLAALDAAWEEAAVHFGPGEQIGAYGARETDEESLIRLLLEREIMTPKAADAVCRRYYDSNPARFRSPDLFEPAHILFKARRDDADAYAKAEAQATAMLALINDIARRATVALGCG